jgi:hypothetical protein
MVQANDGGKMGTRVTDARLAAKQAITNERAVTGAGEEDLRTSWKKFGLTWVSARELSYELWGGSPAVFQPFSQIPSIVDSSPRRETLRTSAAPTLREVEDPRFMEGQGNDSEFEYDDIVQINRREEIRSYSDVQGGRETEDMELCATGGDPDARAEVNDVSPLFVRRQHGSESDGQAEYLAGLPEESAFRPPVEPKVPDVSNSQDAPRPSPILPPHFASALRASHTRRAASVSRNAYPTGQKRANAPARLSNIVSFVYLWNWSSSAFRTGGAEMNTIAFVVTK